MDQETLGGEGQIGSSLVLGINMYTQAWVNALRDLGGLGGSFVGKDT